MTKSNDFSSHATPCPPEVLAGGRSFIHGWEKAHNIGSGNEPSFCYTFDFWRHHLLTVALRCFKWDNLPEMIDPRAIEFFMITYGFGGFFQIEDENFAFAKGCIEGNLDMYYNPRKVRFIADNTNREWLRPVYLGFKKLLRQTNDAVILWDNVTRVPFTKYIDLFAQRLSNMDKVVDQHIAAQAVPYIIEAPEEQRISAKALYTEIAGLSPVIFGNKGFSDKIGYSVFNSHVNYQGNDILLTQNQILNLAYMLFGVDNGFNGTKKERLLVDEVNTNNEQIMLFRNSRLEERKRFCDTVNDIWGLDIKCDWSVNSNQREQLDTNAGGVNNANESLV